MELRDDYWSGVIGHVPEANVAFLVEARAWLDSLGQALVERGFAASYEIRDRLPGTRQPAAGQIVLYAVSAIRADVGATLVVMQIIRENPYKPGRADGVSVHAQAREIVNGHWRSDNVDNNPVSLISLKREAVLSTLQGILEGRIAAPEKSNRSD